jgi:hypothetical protein
MNRKMNAMKPLLYTVALVIAITAFSCLKSGQNDYYIRTTGNVQIVNAFIPDTVNNMEIAEISATAEAYDACWSNLNFLLTKSSEFEYTLQAFGIYESYGDCPSLIVRADTTIALQVVHTGLYKFHIYKGPNDTETDTLIVK